MGDVCAAQEAAAQARTGAYNRRVARSLERGEGLGEFFCTCGRPDCDEILVLTAAEYGRVEERPYRFLVAPGHATEADEVVERTGEYDVVEVLPAYRELVAAIVSALDEAA